MKETRSHKRIAKLLALFILLICSGLLYAYFEARNVKLKQMVYKNKDIPDAFVGKKIVLISDTHINHYFTADDFEKIVTRVNALNPDILLLLGDYTIENADYSYPFFENLKNLKSKHGAFFVLGNHDHWENASLIREEMEKCGFLHCDNRSYWIKEGNDSIKIGGVGDFWEDLQIIENTIHDISNEHFCIMLSHNPDYIETIETDLIDLMFSGHTHAGQITFFGLWAPIMPATLHPESVNVGEKYRYGWKKKDNIDLYISSGIGMGIFPLRFCANPEIVEITLSR